MDSIIKKSRGRPKKTEEEKKENKRIYMKKYQNERYRTDDVYKKKKISNASNFYHKSKSFI